MKKRNGIRYLVLVLSLVLVIAVFASCNSSNQPSGTDESTQGGETTQEPAKNVTISLADYKLLVPTVYTKAESSAASALLVGAQEALGAEFKEFGEDFVANEADIDPNAFEILVGNTNRPESREALESLEGGIGYVVKLVGNKIVINASANGLIDDAVQYFLSEYVTKGANGSFEIPETLSYTYTGDGAAILNLATGESRYKLLFSESLDTTSGSDEYDRVDYVVNYFVSLRSTMIEELDLDDVPIATDFYPVEDFEILLGRTTREETAVFLQNLKPNEYGFGVVGNKLVIAGWSDYTIGLAVELFKTKMSSFLVNTADGVNLVLCEDDTTIEAYEPWNVDVPLYNAGRLDGAVELINNGYQAYYVDTNAEEYKAYLTTVTDAGYKLHQENQIGNNLYATFTNGKTMLHAYYTDYLGAVRVIVESTATAILPPNTDNPGKKVTDVKLTLFDFDTASGNWGNCFIVTLEDGSFILHDGGADKGGRDSLELWNLLNRLNQREDGKIVIAAWIISHQHYDHFKNGYDTLSKYAGKNLVLEKILFNVPSPSLEYNSRNPNAYWKNGNFHTLKMKSGCQLIVMHTGQTIQIRNVKLEVVYTCDDIYPLPPEKFNNSAFVTRMTVGEGADAQTVIILGDAEEVACKIMSEMHGEAMKCDIVSVAHHGWGGSVQVYALCKPSVVVWPGTKSESDSQLKAGNTGYYPTIHQSLMNQSNVKMLVVGDYGHRTFTLPVKNLTNDRNANLNNLVTIWPREDGLTY